MKNLSLLALMLFVLCSACDKDDDTDPIDETRTELSYDGVNNTAPRLPADTYEFGIRLPAAVMNQHQGKKLEEIQFYILERPASCEVRIYERGTDSAPDSLIYSADVIGNIATQSWNNHLLSDPIALSGNDLWVSIRAEHTSDTQSVGCDGGTARNGGDWIYGESGQEWVTFRTFTGTESINWNIKAFLALE